jgi:hypothetical protein
MPTRALKLIFMLASLGIALGQKSETIYGKPPEVFVEPDHPL